VYITCNPIGALKFMNITELIKQLEILRSINGDVQVMVLDGFNGDGKPRDLNLGPLLRTIDDYDAAYVGDCENRQGETVAVIGFGSY
jgi:hypothetical protein